MKIVTANGECGDADGNKFGQMIVGAKYDEALTEGFGVRPYTWGASLSVQHELFPRVSVSAGDVRRWFGNFNSITQNVRSLAKTAELSAEARPAS